MSFESVFIEPNNFYFNIYNINLSKKFMEQWVDPLKKIVKIFGCQDGQISLKRREIIFRKKCPVEFMWVREYVMYIAKLKRKI